MDLPINLFFILQGKIQLFEGTGNKSRIDVFGTSSSQQNYENINTNLIKIDNISQNVISTHSQSNLNKQEPHLDNKKNEINTNYRETSIQQQQIEPKNQDPQEILKKETYSILEALLREINNKTTALEVFKATHKIITNIIGNPNEEKFRRLKKDSNFYKTNIAPYLKAKTFLEFLFFSHSKDNQYYEYLGDVDYLIKIGEILNEFLIEKSKIIMFKYLELAQINFNPYESSITSSGGATRPDQLKKAIPPTDFDELMKKEKARRAEIVRNSTKTEREPKVLEIKGNSIGAILNNLNDEIDQSETKLEEQDYYRFAQTVLRENSSSDKFKLRSRTEYEKLINSKTYTKAIIRFKFPNEILLQANFALMETIGDMYKFIREYIADPSLDFYLTTSPPLKKYTNPNATIHQENLFPSTLMYVNFPTIDPQKNSDYVYLNDSVKKLI